MTEQETQIQRSFDKLTKACPKEWIICQQEVFLEDLRAQNAVMTEEIARLKANKSEVEQAGKANAEAVAKNDTTLRDRK